MKKLNNIFLAIAAVAVMSVSCSKDFLDTAPTSAVSETDVLNTVEHSMMAVNGLHRLLYNSVGSSWNSQGGYPTFCLHLDAMDDDCMFTFSGGNFFPDDAKWIRHRDLTHKYNDVKYYWYTFYKVVSNANKILTVIDGIPGDDDMRSYIKGQAFAYRAFAHHMLVQAWAERYDWTKQNNDQPGVILRLDNNNENQARATVEEVYTKINSDLDSSILCLGNTKQTRFNKSHIDINVAKGIKVRVLMCQGKWAEAAALADEVIKNCGASLSKTTYTDPMEKNRFGDANNSEWIWACVISRTDATQYDGSRNWFDFTANSNTSYNKNNPRAINSLLYESIPSTDARKAMWVKDPVTAISEGKTVYRGSASTSGRVCMYMSQKFLVDTPAASGVERDVPYMRLPEMILNAAESYARAGQTSAAQTLLLKLAQDRDPSYTLANGTVFPGEEKTLINQIMWQKRVELWSEMGFRWLDLKRLNLPCDRGPAPRSSYNQGPYEANKSAANLDPEASNYDMYGAKLGNEARVIPAGDKRWQWLIPTQELASNPLCTQND